MFFRRAQADDTNRVVIRAFREDHHIKTVINQPNGDEANSTTSHFMCTH
jgi:hypothetical protein